MFPYRSDAPLVVGRLITYAVGETAAGDEFEGWTLDSITQQRLRFVAGPNEYEMIFPPHADRGQ